MPFEIVRNDIVNMSVDAIVDTANPRPQIGYGVDAGIHRKAGPKLLEARKKIGNIRVGDAAITPAFDLPARYVIHIVGPVWQDGSHSEEKLLRSCYQRSLKLAKRYRCRSVAFPLISTGNYGFPKPLALQIAMNTISEFLLNNEMQVYLVVFSRDAFQLSEKLFQGVSSFIDENYIREKTLQQYGFEGEGEGIADLQERIIRERINRRQEDTACYSAAPCETMAAPPKPEPKRAEKKTFSLRKAKPSLAQLLAETDAGFSETLLKLIDRTGKKDSDIYTKANISRQHFSKIRNNPDYKPTKTTAIALALALELDLEQTRDLIGRAGYALTNSSKFDVIIMYFIREKNYNLFDINAALFEFDQSLLGATS
ncbi:MAG: macro domain-containing protein [Candidatus Limivicinus sp.]|nr:macro domain-containing protein [Clostridiales bacterium]MDY6131932.1 macro domain-containing protein [Candidatus Limivicinus sp.]